MKICNETPKTRKPSKVSFLKNLENGKLETNRGIVLNAIINFDANNVFTMRKKLRLSHQSITSVLTYLHDCGLIKANGTVLIDQTEYTRYVYVQDEQTRLEVSKERKMEKYLAWLKRSEDFKDVMPKELFNLIFTENV